MSDNGESWWQNLLKSVTPLSQVGRSKRQYVVISTPTILDLHGMTIRDAHLAVGEFIEKSTVRDITIITGRSGEIRREFPEWLRLNNRVANWEEQSGGGAFRIRLRP